MEYAWLAKKRKRGRLHAFPADLSFYEWERQGMPPDDIGLWAMCGEERDAEYKEREGRLRCEKCKLYIEKSEKQPKS